MKKTDNYSIEIADDIRKYEGLRTLWCEVFNDEPEFVDSMYKCFGANPVEGIYTSENIKGYVAVDDEGDTLSALTCFRSGEFENQPAYTSYAICTEPSARGLGLAGRLVEYARDMVIEAGGISVISPAEPSLEKFYGAHGYEPFFYAKNCEVSTDEGEDFDFDAEDREYGKFAPAFEMTPLDGASYNRCREVFLANRPHIIIGEEMMRLIYNESRLSDGRTGLFRVNKDDAICALSEQSGGRIEITELLINPRLEEVSPEIAAEIARRIAEHFGQEDISYRTTGAGYCQSMAAGIGDKIENECDGGIKTDGDINAKNDSDAAKIKMDSVAVTTQIKADAVAYYGFPID